MSASQTRRRQIVQLGLFVCVSLFLSGCGGGRARIESTQNMKILGLTIITYKQDQGRWPDKLSDVKERADKTASEIGGDKDFAALMKNPLTGADPGYEYVKPKKGDSLNATVMLYQLRDGKRDEALPKCYQSGSVRLT